MSAQTVRITVSPRENHDKRSLAIANATKYLSEHDHTGCVRRSTITGLSTTKTGDYNGDTKSVTLTLTVPSGKNISTFAEFMEELTRIESVLVE